MKSLGSIVFVFAALIVQGQIDSVTNDILTTKKFRYGIFGNPKEFRENSPSFTSDFRIEIDSSRFQGRKVYHKVLKYNSGEIVTGAYGFSDGTYLYVNARTFDFSQDYFLPVLVLGRVIYFEDFKGAFRIERTGTGLTWFFGFAGSLMATPIAKQIATENPGWVIYLSDDDGRAYRLGKKTMASILKQHDRELYQKLKTEKNPDDIPTLKNYLLEFNRRRY